MNHLYSTVHPIPIFLISIHLKVHSSTYLRQGQTSLWSRSNFFLRSTYYGPVVLVEFSAMRVVHTAGAHPCENFANDGTR